jgi:hypothetical protein
MQITLTFALAAFSYSFVENPIRQANWSTSKITTIALGLFAAVSSGSILYLLNGGFRGALYTGTPAQMIAKGVESLMNQKWHAGNLIWRAPDCICRPMTMWASR